MGGFCPYTARGETHDGFRDVPSSSNYGQCFGCGQWFRNSKGFASCAEHQKRQSMLKLLKFNELRA